MRPCLFLKSAFALWRVGSNSRGDDVHPRVAMQILRHSQIAVTMDVYSQVTSDSTLQALKALGERLEH
jgi:integrase